LNYFFNTLFFFGSEKNIHCPRVYTKRHTDQMKEVMGIPSFPKK